MGLSAWFAFLITTACLMALQGEGRQVAGDVVARGRYAPAADGGAPAGLGELSLLVGGGLGCARRRCMGVRTEV